MGRHSLLQRIFSTQGSNAGLPHCRQILYCLSHQGSPSPGTAAKSPQSCLTLCDPIPGIPRQEHWSGLPFPSPVHKSEKWKWSRTVMSDSSRLVAFNSHRMGLARSFAPYCMARVVWLSVRLSLNHTRHLHGEHRHDGDTALSLLELPPQCCTEMPLGRGKSLE